ncbi:MAG: FISUMP domain-containing protein, partial [Bacteroidales bacterium]|nr:FISUMP domain-containing protein [Bacteroidales bacterium]
ISTLTTMPISNITSTSATSGGNITNNGGTPVTQRGIVWSTSPNPTTANNSTNDGSGIGNFTSNLTALTANTTYYVRAYATNSAGTAYGDNISFVTTSNPSNPCDGVTPPAGYGLVSSSGNCWLDRNLGATEVATSSTDTAAYGDLYQWGRGTDGHQIRTSATTDILSSTNTPGNSFILAPSSPYDWRSPQNDNLWQGVAGVNNPCPSGYRIPTADEWNTERASWISNNAAGAFASPLKLPVAGYRNSSTGSLVNVGSNGYCWSSTVDGTFSRYLNFYSGGAGVYSGGRAFGFSVRCIKD